jgi:hypothetical protein
MSSTENLSLQAEDMQLYMELYQLQFFLNRIEKNLNLINSVPNAKLITVIGGNLFDLSAKYYQDASQWPYIAKANGLTDPYITGQMTLVIPPYTNVDSGGILQ